MSKVLSLSIDSREGERTFAAGHSEPPTAGSLFDPQRLGHAVLYLGNAPKDIVAALEID